MPYNKKNHSLNLLTLCPANFYLFVCLFVFALGFYCYNYLTYRFPSLDFFSISGAFIELNLFLLLLVPGLKLYFGKSHPVTLSASEFFNYSILILLVCFFSFSIQFTPFFPIDEEILAWQNTLNIPFESLLTWTHKHPLTYTTLDIFYNALGLQLFFIPLVLILGQYPKKYFNEFYFLVSVSTLMGFIFYYFYPTVAPASQMNLELFTANQYATGLKFAELHQWKVPSTAEGGLIALPSFHVIWAWFLTYLIRPFKLAFGLLACINTVLMVSCVLLGWHYPLDILGSALVIGLSHLLYLKTFNHAVNINELSQ